MMCLVSQKPRTACSVGRKYCAVDTVGKARDQGEWQNKMTGPDPRGSSNANEAYLPDKETT